jgi:hypothetical protein
MRSPLAVLPDVEPRYLTVPPAVTTSSADDAVELAASAGLVLDPWQVEALRVCLGERADGKWAARQFGLIVPRQNGKGAVLEALELAALFLFDERLIMHSAHEFKTAAEAFLRVKALIQNTPDLDRRVARNGYHNAHGNEGITLKNGARLKFVARTSGSGRGFSGDRIILDEAYNLSDRGVSALAPAMAARPNPQAIFTSSAPLDEGSSDVLKRIMRRGRSKDPTLGYVEYCALSPDDPDAVAEANPGYPFRIDDDAIEAERGLMLPQDYNRERLGIVDLEDDDAEWVIPATAWHDAGSDSTIPTGAEITYGLAVSTDRSYSTFVAAGPSSLGPYAHIEIAANEKGTHWVVGWAKARGIRVSVRKGTQAASLIADLEAAGVPVDEVSNEEYAKSCGRLFDAAVEGRLRHRNEGLLETAVRKAMKRPYSDSFIWDARKSAVDIAPFEAATIAVSKYLQPVVNTESVYETRGPVEL